MWHPDKNVLYGLGSLLRGNRRFIFLTICVEIISDLQQSCQPLSKHFHIMSNFALTPSCEYPNGLSRHISGSLVKNTSIIRIL